MVHASLTEDTVAALLALEGDSDRSVGIVGAALLESRLRALEIWLLERDEKVSHELFRPAGAIGFFESQIQLGRLLGLYSDAAYRDLMAVKRIRNTFAHQVAVRTFDDQPVRELVRDLRLVDTYTTGDPNRVHPVEGTPPGDPPWVFREDRDALVATGRGRFLLTVMVLTVGLASVVEIPKATPVF